MKTSSSGHLRLGATEPCLYPIYRHNSTMIVDTIASYCSSFRRLIFVVFVVVVVFCSTLRIGPYFFYTEKFITQFKTEKKNDRSPY